MLWEIGEGKGIYSLVMEFVGGDGKKKLGAFGHVGSSSDCTFLNCEIKP